MRDRATIQQYGDNQRARTAYSVRTATQIQTIVDRIRQDV